MRTSPVSREADTAEPETKDLSGRRALVTGGTRGMGAAIAELLVARGAHVIVTARHPSVPDSEPPVSLIQADLAAPEGADFVAGEATRILGGLDIVVHCVGASFAKPGGVLALTENDWADPATMIASTVDRSKSLFRNELSIWYRRGTSLGMTTNAAPSRYAELVLWCGGWAGLSCLIGG
jgi:hypothetical protein